MYSKAEALKIKQEFWTTFGETKSRKWLLYNTKIKDFSFKFYADNKTAKVLLDIEPKNIDKRIAYFEKIESLKNILEEEFIKGLIFEKDHILETGKIISRIWIEKDKISINNKATWNSIFDFFEENMAAFELFYYEYDQYIKNIEI